MIQDVPADDGGTLEVVAEQILPLAPEFRALGVVSLHVFGSRSRGKARRDSDLDVIVEYDRDSRFSLVTLAAVQRIIEDATRP